MDRTLFSLFLKALQTKVRGYRVVGAQLVRVRQF
jgi:hypothetical protein